MSIIKKISGVISFTKTVTWRLPDFLKDVTMKILSGSEISQIILEN
jgi:hypothetical protein